MAVFPCSFCGQRYAGSQQTAYPAIMWGRRTWSLKMRLCPDDFARLVKQPWLRLPDAPPRPSDEQCWRCGENPADVALFVPYYEAGQERGDLYGRVCPSPCLDEARDAFFGPQEPQERASAGSLGL